MIDKDWLEDAIKNRAEDKFEVDWEMKDFENPALRMAWQKLMTTSEWKYFKQAYIKTEQHEITNNVLNQLQGIKSLLNEGEN